MPCPEPACSQLSPDQRAQTAKDLVFEFPKRRGPGTAVPPARAGRTSAPGTAVPPVPRGTGHLLPKARPPSCHSGGVKAFSQTACPESAEQSPGLEQARHHPISEKTNKTLPSAAQAHSPEGCQSRLRERARHLLLGSCYLLKEEPSVTAGVLVRGIRVRI